VKTEMTPERTLPLFLGAGKIRPLLLGRSALVWLDGRVLGAGVAWAAGKAGVGSFESLKVFKSYDPTFTPAPAETAGAAVLVHPLAAYAQSVGYFFNGHQFHPCSL
jgi:hypothetical protein